MKTALSGSEVEVKVEVKVVLRPDPDNNRDYRDRSATGVEVVQEAERNLASLVSLRTVAILRYS